MGLDVDYCTLWPDFIWLSNIYIGECCRIHDIEYDLGVTRATADNHLHQCVSDLGAPITAMIMFAGVSLFGGIFWRKARTK